MITDGNLTHHAVYNDDEIHLGPLDECQTCAGRGLMLPKPPKRIKDPELLARFREVRPWCQVCKDKGTPAEPLETHHMTDLKNTHRRSGRVPEPHTAVPRLPPKASAAAAPVSSTPPRCGAEINEKVWREEYAELELLYDGRVLWASTEEPTS